MPATTLAPTPVAPAAPAQTPLPGEPATSPPAASFEPVLAEAARSRAASDSEDAGTAAAAGTAPSPGEAVADGSAPAEGSQLDTPATSPPGAPAVEGRSEPAAPTPGRAAEVAGRSDTTSCGAATAIGPSNLAGAVAVACEAVPTPGQPAGETMAASGTGTRTARELVAGAAGTGAPGVPLPPPGLALPPPGLAQTAPAPVESAPVEGAAASGPRPITADAGGAASGTPDVSAGQGVTLPGPAAASTAAAPTGRATGSGGGEGAEPAAHTSSRSGQAHAEAATVATAAAPAQPVDRMSVAPPPEIPRARTTLAALADTTHSLIRMAARDGHARALITLRPAELGQVEIRLSFHDGRLTADVVAESRQAADVLLQASGDLRRSLESQGLTIHALDVRDGSTQRGTRGNPHDPARGGMLARHEQGGDDQSTTIEASSLPLPEGMLDVLA